MSLFHRMIHLLYPRGGVRRVLRGPLRGMKFHVVNGMGATYALGLDFMNLKFLGTKLKPGMIVYDVGANCGQMALYFSREVGVTGRVFSFEPVPQNAALLRRNIEMNACANVEVIECAVAANGGNQSFCFDSGHHTMGGLAGSMVKLDTWDTSFEVPCVTLDSMIESGARLPQILKIDVEGGGLGVIEGATKLLSEHRPAIYFELHAADEQAPEFMALQLLRERWGYHVTDLNGTLRDRASPLWGGAVWCEAERSR